MSILYTTGLQPLPTQSPPNLITYVSPFRPFLLLPANSLR